MKTFEFIEEAKELGYDIVDFFGTVKIKRAGEEVATVWTTEQNSISTFTGGGIEDKLLDLIVSYAKTPVEKRKYAHPTYVEYDGNKFLVGKKYHMTRHGESVIAQLLFGENICENQPTAFSTQPGLRGPAGLLSMQSTPYSFGFYWRCEPTDNYEERYIQFTDLVRSTFLEDSPFEEKDSSVDLFSEVKEQKEKS